MEKRPLSKPSAAKNCVLIVDDDADLLRALSETLEEAGYGAVIALDGFQALALLERGLDPDLILLDLMMPRMNGWQVLDEVSRARYRDAKRVPIVLMSALTGSMQTLSWKVDGILPKPVSSEPLLAVVERFLGAEESQEDTDRPSASARSDLWGEPSAVPSQLIERLAVTFGEANATEIVTECLASANLSATRTAQDLLALSYELIVRGGLVTLFGRSIRFHALLAGAKLST